MGVAVPNGVLLLLLGWMFIVVALRANDVDVIPDVLFKPQEVWPLSPWHHLAAWLAAPSCILSLF
jgi:hypothetical protein